MLRFMVSLLVVTAFNVVLLHCEAKSNYRGMIPNGYNAPVSGASVLWNKKLVCDSKLTNPKKGIGHINPNGGGARNQFGLDFAAANHAWTQTLCNQDRFVFCVFFFFLL